MWMGIDTPKREMLNLLVWAIPALLLSEDDTSVELHKEHHSKTTGLNQRLAEAERDEWTNLIERARRKQQEEEEKKNMCPNQLEDKDQAYLRKVNRAIFKANNGCLRAAKQILMGGSQAPPCEETTKMVQGKLPKDDLTEERWKKMSGEIAECKMLSWKVQPLSKRRVVARLEMTKNGAEPGRSRTRNSHLKALQHVPEGITALMNWAQMWMMGLPNPTESQLWLRANIVPLMKEVENPDGSKKTKIRPIALLEIPLKLIESVAVDQQADTMIALMQEQQVGFRVRDGAEATIHAVRKVLRSDSQQILMEGDIANAYGSIDRLAVLQAMREHAPCLAPLCASQFVRNGTIAVIQERCENGRSTELHYSVAKGVWQGSTLSSAAFCLTFWSKMKEVSELTNRERPIMGVIAYADDFIVSSEESEADKVWDETTKALGEIGLEIDQNKSCYTRKGETRWRHKTLKFKKEIVVLGTETTEKNAAAADEMNPSLAQKRLDDAAELAEHVEAVTRMHLDERKSEALWLMTSKSIARSLDFDAKVVHPEKMRPLATKLGERTKKICESLLERTLDEDVWTRMKLPTSLGGMGIREVTSQLAVSYEITKRKTARQSERIAKCLVGRRDEISFDSGLGAVVDSLDVKQEERIERMAGPFKWDLMDAAKGVGFSFSISRTQKMHEITTAHKLWTKLDTTGKAAYLANCGSGVGATWTETAPEQGMLDDEWKTAARRRLRLTTSESKLCECGMNKDEMGDHTLSSQKCPWRTRIHDRVRDCHAKQLRKMGATVDLERVAPQWAKKYKGNDGIGRIRTARIDVVATIPGSNELQWLDITIRRLKRT